MCRHEASQTLCAVDSWEAVPIIVVLVNAWPNLVRPLLDGDSLSYHLPNAATWVQSHTIWISTTRYWWYPGGSELFASGVFGIAGAYAIGICGTMASTMLVTRIYQFAIREGVHGFYAASLAAAVAAIHLVQLQEADLGNDIWLAAFVLEILWCLRYEKDALLRTALYTSLIKPVGFIFTLFTLLLSRIPTRTLALSVLAILFWLARDVVLAIHPVILPWAGSFPEIWTTTIAWHGVSGLFTLFNAIARDGALTVIAFVVLIVAFINGRDRVFKSCAIVFALLFFVEPFGFNSFGPLLANGSSLRFALPALILGVIANLATFRRLAKSICIPLWILTIWNCLSYRGVFAGDSTTNSVFFVLILSVVIAFIQKRELRAGAASLAAMGCISYAGRMAASHPAGYYDDQLVRNGVRSDIIAWVQREKPKSVVGVLLPLGEIAVVSPATYFVDGVDDDSCSLARRTSSLVLYAGVPGIAEEQERAARLKI